MSGGRFDYKQYQIAEIIDAIEQEIIDNGKEKTPDEWYEPFCYSDATIQEFNNGIDLLKRAQVYAQRIDWLLSCDDCEESFHRRLKEELEKLNA